MIIFIQWICFTHTSTNIKLVKPNFFCCFTCFRFLYRKSKGALYRYSSCLASYFRKHSQKSLIWNFGDVLASGRLVALSVALSGGYELLCRCGNVYAPVASRFWTFEDVSAPVLIYRWLSGPISQMEGLGILDFLIFSIFIFYFFYFF